MAGLSTRYARRAVVTVVILVGVAVVGYLVGSHIRSTRQAAADAAAVPRTQLTAPVRSSTLSSQLVFRATYSAGAVSGVTTMPNVGADDPVVTKIFITASHQIDAGQPLIEVAGTPIIALPGQIPSYRDLHNGDSGPDVAELQVALQHLGYGATDSGTLDAPTAAAFVQLLHDDGYPPPVGTKPTGARLTIAKGTVTFLRRLPATVATVATTIGSTLDSTKPWAYLRTGVPSLTASVAADVAAQLHVGGHVALYDDLAGTHGIATISHLSAPSALSDGTGTVVRTQLAVTGRTSFTDGADLRAVATVRSTSRAVLNAPVVAIHTNSSGATYLTVVRAGRRTDIGVRTGLTADGYVQVTPTDGSLAAGDQVVISD